VAFVGRQRRSHSLHPFVAPDTDDEVLVPEDGLVWHVLRALHGKTRVPPSQIRVIGKPMTMSSHVPLSRTPDVWHAMRRTVTAPQHIDAFVPGLSLVSALGKSVLQRDDLPSGPVVVPPLALLAWHWLRSEYRPRYPCYVVGSSVTASNFFVCDSLGRRVPAALLVNQAEGYAALRFAQPLRGGRYFCVVNVDPADPDDSALVDASVAATRRSQYAVPLCSEHVPADCAAIVAAYDDWSLAQECAPFTRMQRVAPNFDGPHVHSIEDGIVTVLDVC